MSFKRMTEQELENAKSGLTGIQIGIVNNLSDAYAEIDRLNGLLQKHA